MPRDTRRAALTISEFARRTGLSHKALRLYDLSGLLPPAEVDPVNGYRLYAPEQIERAKLVSLLRRLDMPLATVAEVLDADPESMARQVAQWWNGQEEQHRVRRELIDYLRSEWLSTDPQRPEYWVATRSIPETKVASIRREVDQTTLVDTMSAAAREIRTHLATSGTATEQLGFGREEWWIYHGMVTPDSEAPVEVCVPFTGPAEPTANITIRVEPAHVQAYTTVTKRECLYPRILHAYDAVTRFVRDTELSPFGPSREIYFTCLDDVGDDDPFAYVAQPIERILR
ncbi:MAG: MerR family transcriptional regulator [Hamadaea sp.]|uniref:MerR family transcriptional regulator n=1 Tax=Hamadaea sp. TaxID=2024425 RepID=UPI00181E2CB8|nr:MerR family transcriptional regulator [Hamadaea sp.]NUR71866.1 MerR family transcriptional regulator [Hamadaea sp.]NUT19886.1 MerR family transcriptional regulator [Hamadaea sp.]